MYIIVPICKKRSKFQKILKDPNKCCIGIGQFEINNQSLVSTAYYYWGKHIYSRGETIGEYIVENGIPNYRWIKCDKKVIGRETRCVKCNLLLDVLKKFCKRRQEEKKK